MKKTYSLNEKSVLIILRFLVIIVSALLVIYGIDAGAAPGLKTADICSSRFTRSPT